MAIREVDAITDAIIETEREIAGDAWGIEDTERDTEGDRSLEDLGEGLEGQHEPEDEPEGDEPEGDDESDEVQPAIAAKPEGDKPEVQPQQHERNLVPPGKLREANERARAAEAALEAFKAEQAKGNAKALEDKLELALREIENLKRGPVRVEPQHQVEKPKRPDLFEDPDGAIAFVEQGVQQQIAPLISQIQNLRVENSMAVAHVAHKDVFEKAFDAMKQLNPQNPDDFAAGRKIVNSPNPGEALVDWYRRRETLARVGSDPTAYEERIRAETRRALMEDPEFKKQLIAELRGEAARGDNGQPRTTTRIPRSLNGVAGSNIASRGDPHQYDDSEQGVADSAWQR